MNQEWERIAETVSLMLLYMIVSTKKEWTHQSIPVVFNLEFDLCFHDVTFTFTDDLDAFFFLLHS